MQIGPDPRRINARELERLARVFRLLGDSGRLRLVAELLDDRELSVRTLASAASLSETATSQQLRLLHEAGVVARRRVGRQILYRLRGGDVRALARTAIRRAEQRSAHSRPRSPTVTYIITEPCIDVKDKSCIDVCPVEAIFPEDAVPDKWTPFIRINYAYNDGVETVEQLVREQVAENPPPPIAGHRE